MSVFSYVKKFFDSYVLNYLVARIPIWALRKSYYRMSGLTLGDRTILDMDQYFLGISKLTVGSHSHVNRKCTLDARGGLTIGNHVSISHHVSIISASHDYRSPTFAYSSAPIVIEDYVWIGINATILQGVTIGRGAVVSAGAVVTRTVAPFTVVGGIPAKEITTRPQNLDYDCTQFAYYGKIRKPYFR